jgi:hypothetical protein
MGSPSNHRPRRCLAVLWVCVLAAATRAFACDSAPVATLATSGEIKAFFDAQDRRVVTFVGYSGAGYEDRAAMLEQAKKILARFDPSATIVNIGATSDGIGAVYELAKRDGFVTTGIVSTQAMRYNAPLSPCVDHVFYVQDETWGGFIDDGHRLSPTSSVMVENSDLVIGIGGGEVARDELTAARRLGKETRYFAADMDHQKAIDKALKKGREPPDSFAGAAAEAFRPTRQD